MPEEPDFDLTIANSVADLPSEWDNLIGPDDAFLATRWLTVVEKTAGVPIRYVVARQNGTVVAGVVTALATSTVPWVGGRPDSILLKAVAEAAPGADAALRCLPGESASALMPALVAGGRHVGNTHVLLGPSATREHAEALIRRVESLAIECGAASVAFPYADEGAETLRSVLAARQYRYFRSGQYCRLWVPDGGFDAYLAGFTYKRRCSIRTERRRVTGAGLAITFEPLRDDTIPVFAELDAGLRRKYGITWPAEKSVATLTEVLNVFGDDSLAIAARDSDGRVRAFGLVLRHQDRWYVRQCGFDYEFQEATGLPLYFELLYYRLVEAASAAGVTALHYGLGSVDAKQSRGCVVSDQHCFIRRTELA